MRITWHDRSRDVAEDEARACWQNDQAAMTAVLPDTRLLRDGSA